MLRLHNCGAVAATGDGRFDAMRRRFGRSDGRLLTAWYTEDDARGTVVRCATDTNFRRDAAMAGV